MILNSLFIIPTSVYAASSPWTQTDWIGGSGQTSWSNTTKYDSSSSVTTSTANQVTLTQTSSWYNASWAYRKKITFDNSAQAENLTNFPVLVKLSSSNFDFTKAQSAGQDIRFTDSDGTTALSYEIESWDNSGQTANVWVKVPQIDLSSATDNIYMYYGNSSATDGQAATSVWDSNYVGAWHLPNGTTLSVNDSTSNGNNGTNSNVTATTGQVDGAGNFNGNSSTDINTTFTLNGVTGFTVEAWIYPTSMQSYKTIWSIDGSGASCEGEGLYFSSGTTLNFRVANVLQSTAISDITNTWTHVVAIYNSTSRKVYFNNVLVLNTAGGNAANGNTSFRIGSYNNCVAGTNFPGKIDEVRISNLVRSATWIAASYKSETDAFNTFNSEEERYASSGNLTSSIFDTEQQSNWGTLTYNTDGVATTTVKARTSNSSSMAGATDFASCNSITSGTDISSNNCVADTHRYIQYQIALTSVSANTPTFQDVSIAFTASDSTPPSISLTALATDPNSDTTPTLSGTATESVGTVSNVQYQMDGTSGSWTACTADDGSFDEATETFTCTPSALSDGSHTMYVRATDSNSNTTSNASASTDTFTIDVTAPASFDLDFPGHNSYTTNDRPTFKWKATTDATSGLSSYTLEIDNGDTGDFSITGIPASRTTDYDTSKYLVHYDGFSDSDSTNNYISIYTKSSSSWGTGENDGKLKEGSAGWKIKALDNAGNERSEGRTVIVDLTGPILSSLSSSDSAGSKNGYQLVTNQKPNITGTITDNYSPDKVEISIYKENYFLGAITSKELFTSLTYSLSNSSNKTSLAFSIPVSDPLNFGSYEVTVKGQDKAGNKSTVFTLYLKVVTAKQAQELLQGKLSEKEKGTIREHAQISLPELEKKAILRREKEASEFRKLTKGFSDQINSVTRTTSVIAGQFTLSVVEGWQSLYKSSTAWIPSPLSVWARAGMTREIAGNMGNVILSETKNLSSVTTKFGGTVSNQAEIASSAINHGFLAMTNTAGQGIGNGAKATFSVIASTSEAIGQTYNNLALKAPGIIKNSMLAVANGVTASAHTISSSNQLALNTLNQSQKNLESQVQKTSKETADNFQFSIHNFQSNINDQISNAKNIAGSTGNVIAGVNEAISNSLNRSQENIQKQIAQTHKNTSDNIKNKSNRISKGISLAFRSFQKPVSDTANLLDRTKVWLLTFESIVFDPNPTTISDVAIDELGKDYAVVSWKTNHYAWGKINYGKDLTYGEEVLLTKREKVHTARLTGLKPGEKYYFEVMSQNKNYVYDAYYSFETKK